MKNILIEQTIEAICEKGCQSVRDDIVRLENGQQLAETAGLSRYEHAMVLKELQSIMSVYGDLCRADGKLDSTALAEADDNSDTSPLGAAVKTAFMS